MHTCIRTRINSEHNKRHAQAIRTYRYAEGEPNSVPIGTREGEPNSVPIGTREGEPSSVSHL